MRRKRFTGGENKTMKYSVRRPKRPLTVFFAILLAAIFNGVFAQNEAETIRVDTNLVLVNVVVRDKDGQLVRGLKLEQFELFDGDVKLPIEGFSAEEAPISIGIIYDMHPTTDDRTKAVIDSLRQFRASLKPEDDIFLVAFNMRGVQTFDFIPTFEQLEKHMAVPIKQEPYSLYDAVYFSSDRIQSSRNRKRMLLIVSDSANHQSRHTFSEVREKIGEIKAEVYAVIFDEDDRYGYADITHKSNKQYPFSRDASPLDRAAIQDLALKSGGGAYFGPSQNAARLFGIYSQIAEEMRSHYTLGFYPDVVDDNTHNVRVRLRGVKGTRDLVLTYGSSYRNQKRAISR